MYTKNVEIIKKYTYIAQFTSQLVLLLVASEIISNCCLCRALLSLSC